MGRASLCYSTFEKSQLATQVARLETDVLEKEETVARGRGPAASPQHQSDQQQSHRAQTLLAQQSSLAEHWRALFACVRELHTSSVLEGRLESDRKKTEREARRLLALKRVKRNEDRIVGKFLDVLRKVGAR